MSVLSIAVGAADDRPVHAAVVAALRVMHASGRSPACRIRWASSGQQLADLNARDVGRDRLELAADRSVGLGLHVPEVDVARCAAVEDQDDRFGFAPTDGFAAAIRPSPASSAPAAPVDCRNKRRLMVAVSPWLNFRASMLSYRALYCAGELPGKCHLLLAKKRRQPGPCGPG